MSKALELTITRTIPAPSKTLFEAWLDPKALAQFMKPLDEMPDCKAEADPKEGGVFLIVMQAGEKEIPHRGEYKKIQRYDTLVFTWLSDFTAPESTVTLTFKEIGPSETVLTLHHAGFANEEARNNHEGGWGKIVERLAQYNA